MINFERVMNSLTKEERKRVVDYARVLARRHRVKKTARLFKFNWVGGLKEYKDKFTSVELQHKILEMWNE